MSIVWPPAFGGGHCPRRAGAESRIHAARFSSRKSLEDLDLDFDLDHQRSVKRETSTSLGSLDFVADKENIIFLDPPGAERPTWPPAWHPGLVRLAEAHETSRLDDEPVRLGRIPLIVVDEVGYIRE
ncbi:hypothetical protein Shyhy01_21220 [Streptomyces hygroscopicus subsp. hygroscopicus]|nr:ATP-binding protein [Streptomyces hygroscopicus]GLX49172.1 hypothetical protein Shyhy01_21220 [Streptomyces hygroscopicus subsp. hygroscopicus]